jgi:hypothetical protein
MSYKLKQSVPAVSSQNVPRLKRPRLCAVKTSPGPGKKTLTLVFK